MLVGAVGWGGSPAVRACRVRSPSGGARASMWWGRGVRPVGSARVLSLEVERWSPEGSIGLRKTHGARRHPARGVGGGPGTVAPVTSTPLQRWYTKKGQLTPIN